MAQPSNGEYRLPIINRTIKIDMLPDQPEDMRFVLCPDFDEPQEGYGYVALVSGHRSVRLCAWISKDMHVYPTAITLPEVPECPGQLHFDPWTDVPDSGAIRVQSNTVSSHVTTVGEYHGEGRKVQILSSTKNMGTYQQGVHPLGVVLAACWIAYCYLPAMRGEQVGGQAGRIGELFTAMLDKALPDGLDELIWRGTTNGSNASPFERYAARQLVEAGAGDVRQIAAEHEVGMMNLNSTGMFWTTFDEDEIEGLRRDRLLAVESAMNRLAHGRLDALEADNNMGLVNTLDEAMLDKSGRAAYRNFGQHAKFVEAHKGDPNPASRVYGQEAARGGIWDVMTRFIATCERLILPCRLEYRCDTNPKSGEMEVLFAAPNEMMFPASMLVDGVWQDTRARRAAWVSAYTLRLAGLLADIAFDCGMAIGRVHVTAHANSLDGQPVLSMEFERIPFQMGTLPLYVNGSVDAQEYDDKPAGLVELLKPTECQLQFTENGGLCAIERLPVYPGILDNRMPMYRDTRELPDDLKTLLHAERACELDVMHDDAVIKGSEIGQIMAQNEDSPIGAVFELESVVLRLDAETEDNGGDTRLLYCESPLTRLMVSLCADSADTRYAKAPDALYNALNELRDITTENGETDKALAYARRVVQLAPTTARSHIMEAVTHVDTTEDYGSAINALLRALPFAVAPIDALYAFYRLAYAFWKTDNRELALACYAQCLSMPPSHFVDMAKQEAQELLAEMGDGRELPDARERDHMLHAAGIPTPPADNTMELLTKAAMRLADSGFPQFAEQVAWMIGTTVEARKVADNLDIFPQLRRSLRFGVFEPRMVMAMTTGEESAQD